ncbi:MAG: hypothetical protein K0Q66_2112 [Chitinophagaceae bacterium]|jgi:hypothetical protein|nr:hypothetical protein [Chitinophagaceae bacterium]
MERDINNKPAENEHEERYVDEVTRDKIRKHLSDPNSKITKEDIENVNTDIFNRDDETEGLGEELPPTAPSAWDIKE